jgi:hypothetical protein
VFHLFGAFDDRKMKESFSNLCVKEDAMTQHVYVSGWNCGVFRLSAVVDSIAMMAPTLFRWRARGPNAVSLPGSLLTGTQLQDWVDHLRLAGFELRSVS